MRSVVTRDEDGWISTWGGNVVVKLTSLPARNTDNKRLVINLKGCNGSGKSTIPMQMLDAAKHPAYLTAYPEDKKPIGVYVEETNTVILGTYTTACGGCDALGDTQIVKRLLIMLWKRDVNIIYEGVIVGDIMSTFYELMKAFNTIHERNVSFCFMGTTLKTCFERIHLRNGGKEINRELVRSKYRNSRTQLTHYLEAGDVDCQVLDTSGSKVEVYKRFMDMYPDLKRGL